MAPVLAMGIVLAAAAPRVDAGGPSKAARKAARAAFERGRGLQEAGDYAAAIEAYARAREHVPDPALTFNIARCHHLDGNADAAIAAYEQFIEEAPGEGPGVAEARGYIAELEALLRREREREEARQKEREEEQRRFKAAEEARTAAAGSEDADEEDPDTDAADVALEADAPEPPEPKRNRLLWLGAGAALVGAGLLLDTMPDSSQNDSLEALDFAPVGLYAAGLAAVAIGVF